MVDSQQYIDRQRGNKGGGPTLFWIFLIVVVLVGAIFMGHVSK